MRAKQKLGLFNNRYNPAIDPSRIILVATDGSGDAGTIGEALAIANSLSPAPSTTAPVTIQVATGDVTENNPLTIPTGISIEALDSPGSWTSRAADPTQPIFLLNSNTALRGLQIYGANGGGGVGIQTVSGATRIQLYDLIITINQTNLQLGIWRVFLQKVNQ